LANRVVGIDFGHGVVRGVEVEDPGTKRHRVVRMGTVPLPPDAVVSGEVRDVGLVASTLKQLWSKAGFKSRRTVLGMGNSRVLARDLQVPVRPLAQIRESLKFVAADMLPMPLENAVLDYYPISVTTDESGIDLYDGMLLAALKDVVLQNAKAVRLAGFELVGVDMIAFALVRILSDRTSTETCAYVDVGATTTIISIATSGVPEFVRVVPTGGEDITRSLMDLGQLSRDQAEQIKRTVGLSADGVEARYRPVVELMVTRSGELMTSIRDTIQYFADTRQRRVARIVLTGGGARVGGFAQMVSAWTRIPAVVSETVGDSEYTVATALTTGVRNVAEGKKGAVLLQSPAAVAPVAPVTMPEPAAGPPQADYSSTFASGPGQPIPAPFQGGDQSGMLGAPAFVASVPTPGANGPFAGAGQPAPSAGGQAKAAKAAKAAKPEKVKKESIWTRPLGGGKK
jgi:type IV pilus assembly protein PilM